MLRTATDWHKERGRFMTFSEYAQGLRPFCSNDIKTDADFFTALISNFIEIAALDACPLLNRKPDTQYRYYTGTPIIPKNAQYLYEHRDLTRYENWVNEKMDESVSYTAVENWLKENGYPGEDPAYDCATLLESIILEITKQRPVVNRRKKNDVSFDLNLINEIQEKIKALPRPKEVPVPPDAVKSEQPFIDELLRAYGDAEQMEDFTREDLVDYQEYADDLADRRVDYYAAETIRRGVLELRSDTLTGQFDVLQGEMYEGVKNTDRSNSHANGYERMLAVMEQAAITPVTNYLLSASPYWISAKIKQGVCHHLVNANKLWWVKRRRGT